MAIETIKDISEIQLNGGTKIRVVLSKLSADKFGIDVRRWYLDDGDEWRPTQKGIMIPAEHVGDIVQAIEQGVDELKKIGGTSSAKKTSKRPVKKAATRRTQRRS